MTLKELIKNAYSEQFAVGGFGFYNLESAKAIVEAVQKTKKPAFLMVTEKSIEYAGLDQLLGVVEKLKREAETPFYLHLDHGKNVETVRKCVKSGFDSVMFDGSGLPFDQNSALSRELCRYARRNGVVFEAEIGHVGGKEDNVSANTFKTNPSEALHFQELVKPDMLAVAIGNIHGEQTAKEELDFTLLAKISDLIKSPLVLHGCSNRASREYQVAISQGIVKINIDTELRQMFVDGITAALKKKQKDPREILALASKKISGRVAEKIELFSNSKMFYR